MNVHRPRRAHGRRRPRRPLPVALASASSSLTFAVGLSLAAAAVGTPPAPARAAQEAPEAPQATQAAVVIKRVEVLGAREVSPEKAAAAAKGVVGRPAEAGTIREAADAVRALYREGGMPLAQVVGTEVTPDGVLRLTVAEGAVRRVLIRGNGKTQARVIRAAVDMNPGDVYREDRVRDARNRLGRLGIFEEVVITPSFGDEPESEDGEKKGEEAKAEGETKPAAEAGKPSPPPVAAGEVGSSMPGESEVGFVDLVVRVKERRTGNIAATVGYTDGSGLVGFVDVSEENFNGSAQRLSAQWQRFNQATFTSEGFLVDERARSAYEVSYLLPTLGPRSLTFNVSLYDKNTIFLPFFAVNQETIRSYEMRRGGTVRVGRGIGNGITAFVSGRRDEVGYDRVPDHLDPPEAAIRDSFGTVAALGVGLLMDGRDDAVNPRRGFWRSLAFESAGSLLGGDRNFNQATLDLRQYVPTGGAPQAPVIAMRLLGGTTTGDVPLSEQFWLGGYELLRGYDLFSIRGDRMLLGSVEARFPLGPGIQGALFTDVGNAWEPGEKVSLGAVKAGVGAGLRFLTPIGPIRLDVAYGSDVQTYVSLGQSY